MAKTINDPVFGDLEYNNEGYWSKKIDFTLFGFKEHQIDLMVKCEKGGIISDIQRDAYKSYLVNMDDFEGEFPMSLLTYFKDHYEDLGRSHKMVEKLKIDLVNEDVSLDYFVCKSLFIDENGNYGWLANHIWKNNPISVILSDDKIRIYEGWAVLVNNYRRIEDNVFGDMVYERSWQKWIKRDYNGLKGEWFPVIAKAYIGQDITQEQRNNYLKYIESEEDFLEEIPHALMAYYLSYYDEIEECWHEMPAKYSKDNINMDSLKELFSFHMLFFNRDGKRYGWLCGCAWDDVHGLSFYYDGESDEMKVGWKDDLFM